MLTCTPAPSLTRRSDITHLVLLGGSSYVHCEMPVAACGLAVGLALNWAQFSKSEPGVSEADQYSSALPEASHCQEAGGTAK